MWACRALLPLAAFATVAVAAAAAGHQDPSLTAFINADWSAYLSDRAAVERHIKCVLDKMPCDADGLKLKSLVPFMMDQNCRKCSNNEKLFTRKLKRLMAKHYPEAYRDMALLARRLQRQGAAAAAAAATTTTTISTVSRTTDRSCIYRCCSWHRLRHRHGSAIGRFRR
ncbi:ejaculatory bulb-specific protein 3-like [Schistocerca americana]|uniref:ejaculatory bulb-specific protein 3-like n=1 Tax=Schistocerca americana TaxID=7009 RepID=UPI001F4F7310|nr:ejaculatory bulb-specific protein 3-like [Schistocerca americana]